MTFKKNDIRINRNGRPVGAKNKVPIDLRNCISAYIEDNFDSIIEDIQSLEPKDRVLVYIKLLEYTLPKLQNITAEFTDNNMIVVKEV